MKSSPFPRLPAVSSASPAESSSYRSSRSFSSVFDGQLAARLEASAYWKSSCFGLNEVSIIDAAITIQSISGCPPPSRRPSDFLCLLYRLVLLSPEPSIVLAYLNQRDFPYLRLLAAFYIRLLYHSEAIVDLLSPLLEEFPQNLVIFQWDEGAPGFSLMASDEIIWELLTKEIFIGISLPTLACTPKVENVSSSDMGDLLESQGNLQEILQALVAEKAREFFPEEEK